MLTIKSTIHHKVLQNPMTTFWKQTQKAMAYAWLNPIPMFVCLLTNELYFDLDPSHRSKDSVNCQMCDSHVAINYSFMTFAQVYLLNE